MTDAPSFIDLLDLPPGTTIAEIATSAPPTSAVGLGFATGGAAPTELTPFFTQIRFDTGATDIGIDLMHWDHDPAFVRVTTRNERLHLDVRSGCAEERAPGDIIVDSRSDPAWLLHASPSGTIGIRVERGHVKVFAIHGPPLDASLAALAPFVHESIVTRVVPPLLPALSSLLEGASAPKWLDEAYGVRSSSPSLVTRIEALGLVARLWSPTTAADRKLAVIWMRAGRGTPAQRVVDWLVRNDGTAIAAEAAYLAVGNAIGLFDRITSMSDLAEQVGDVEMRDIVTGTRIDRDDLESVAAIAYLAGAESHGLRAALDAIDECALVRMTLISDRGAQAESPRLDALVRESPDAWWALGCR